MFRPLWPPPRGTANEGSVYWEREESCTLTNNGRNGRGTERTEMGNGRRGNGGFLTRITTNDSRMIHKYNWGEIHGSFVVIHVKNNIGPQFPLVTQNISLLLQCQTINMKFMKRFLLCMTFMLTASISDISAYDFKTGGICYNIITMEDGNKAVEVTNDDDGYYSGEFKEPVSYLQKQPSVNND